MPSAASAPRPGPRRPPGDAQLILVSLAVAGAAAAIPRAGRHLAGPGPRQRAGLRQRHEPLQRQLTSDTLQAAVLAAQHPAGCGHLPGAPRHRAHAGVPAAGGHPAASVPQPGMPGRRDDHPRCRIPADPGQESQIQARGKPGGTPRGHRPGQHAREHRVRRPPPQRPGPRPKTAALTGSPPARCAGWAPAAPPPAAGPGRGAHRPATMTPRRARASWRSRRCRPRHRPRSSRTHA